jgi:predicted DNA binding CopG/RHH family protein
MISIYIKHSALKHGIAKAEMSKLTEKQINERRKRMQKEALQSVAKTEQLNIRIDEDNIRRLYSLGAKKNLPVGTMVREWITERLKLEEQRKPAVDLTELIMSSITSLHNKIDRLAGNK